MNMKTMKSMTKKLFLPLLVGGMMWSGAEAKAGDVINLYSPQKGSGEFTAAGSKIDVVFRLWGQFVLTNSTGLVQLQYPTLTMRVNGELGTAVFNGINAFVDSSSGDWKTDVKFQYTVMPGDMAAPLRVYGSSSGQPFDIWLDNWKFINVATGSNAVWQADLDFHHAETTMGSESTLDFSGQNIRILTLSFDPSSASVAGNESTTMSVDTTDTLTNQIAVQLFTLTNGVFELEKGLGTISKTLQLAALTKQKEFGIYGLAVGAADLYVMRSQEYNKFINSTYGSSVTNYAYKKATITVTTPPAPTVRVQVADDSVGTFSDKVTLSETKAYNTGLFKVVLSEAFTNDVYVQLDATPSGQSNLTFNATPCVVRIEKGETESTASGFNVPDGTATSAGVGITLTPTVTNNPAFAYFTRIKSATAYIKNVAPTISTNENVGIVAERGVPVELKWNADDVDSDRNAGLTVTWSFGDGASTNLTGASASGSIYHTYTKNGSWSTKVTVKDKDGDASSTVLSIVTVEDPTPQPSVTLSAGALEYGETDTINTGSLNVRLSEIYTAGPVDVLLTATLLGGAQSNLVFATQVVSIPPTTNSTVNPIKFSLPDGTPDSESNGILITPTVTNEPAKSYFTQILPTAVYVTNNPPVIVTPPARSTSLTPLPAYTNVPFGRPFAFRYEIADVSRDASTMKLHWWFEDGATKVDVANTGLNGSTSHTYGSLGTKTVRVQAEDKDGGLSPIIEFPITVVPPPPDPTVYVLPNRDTVVDQLETDPESYVTVNLSEAFTNSVTVNLAVSPVTNAVNGVIELDATQIVFTVGEKIKRVYYRVKDGTAKSRDNMLQIVPTVVGNAAAVAYFTEATPGYIRIYNVAPQILTPEASDLTTDSYLYTISQGTPKVFTWLIEDVDSDLRKTSVDDMSPLTIAWEFGDGYSGVGYGASGTITNTYSVTGSRTVTVTATDKDGGKTTIKFKVLVQPTKEVLATPVGPGGSYYAASGLGYGTLSAPKARTPVTVVGYSYDFKFEWGDTSATIYANPCKFNDGHDSFFFTWVSDAIEDSTALDPYQSCQIGTNSVMTYLMLPTADTNNVTPASVSVRAIFSKEFLTSDNMGDINADGIPDYVAFKIETAGGTTTTGSDTTTAGLTNYRNYNDDEDYIPVGLRDGLYDYRPVSSASGGNAFTAYKELRGQDTGGVGPSREEESELYYTINGQVVTEQKVREDEPMTDPTKDDTDGDGLTDGWEYYFWRRAKIDGKTGAAYNPFDASVGVTFDSKKVYLDFDPISTAPTGRDFDSDGLSDEEEMVLGTDPTQWDTDGDGICDGWEVLRGLNPCDPSDGKLGTENNSDGDYMAYASVPRQYALIESPVNVTNAYLVVTNLTLYPNQTLADATFWGPTNANGNITYSYHYGDSNAALAVGMKVALPSTAKVVSFVTTNALVLHYQVMREFGFDPRTAWTGSINFDPHPDRFPAWIATAAHTKAYTAFDEYLVMKFLAENEINGLTRNSGTGADTTFWKTYTTDPMTPDSDYTKTKNDGMPDGWELYVSIDPTKDLSVAVNRTMTISPWDPYDGDVDHPVGDLKDNLTNRREFAGTDSSACYANSAQYGNSNFVGVVSITRPSVDALWLNKFWPSNPWVSDTDGDGLNDLAEKAFIYGAPTDNGSTCIQGGGLNPNAIDTDLDALPDAWEVDFSGTQPSDSTTTYSGMVVSNGMDGTFSDYDQDWDSDGLLNYQEYWVQAVRSFRYDLVKDSAAANRFGVKGVPMDSTYAASDMFTPVTNDWDLSKYPWGNTNPSLWVLLRLGPNKQYVSTDPRNEDSDFDGMDDYYEMYHGLNPILGDPVYDLGDRIRYAYLRNGAVTINYMQNDITQLETNAMDFIRFPWKTGLPWADPDADGLRNMEEKLQANSAAPQCYNTDPTPAWLTDYWNGNSVTARFYFHMGIGGSTRMFFWPGTAVLPSGYSMYSFEMNEGYDTDNDGLSDKSELIASRNVLSDPQDQDDPVRRQAMWFGGSSTNSAASTYQGFSYGEWTLRSFTVELWARPETTNTAQVLIERVLSYPFSDLSDQGEARHNFQIGIAADGRVYAMFDNAGAASHNEHTATVYAYGSQVTSNEWIHIAARMDGAAGVFTLFVNGEVRNAVSTTLIPANGVVTVLSDPTASATESYSFISGMIVLGAAYSAPDVSLYRAEWPLYSDFYKGYIDEVRIWDGARSNSEISSNYKKRFQRSDLLSNRYDVRAKEAKGYSRVWTNPLQLSPELLYHYTFDNLFSAEEDTSVAKAPRGFESDAVTANRPSASESEVGLWDGIPVKSTVYDDYNYVPWIENGVEHLPLFGGATLNSGNNTVTVLMTNSVADSVYWTHTSAGATYGSYAFPNSGNPYGVSYVTSVDPAEAGWEIFSDLLPLGGAYAKQVDQMWDSQGASGVWVETGADSDGDGMPDWWELYISGTMTGAEWDALCPGGNGMTYGERYQRDLANGATTTDKTGATGVKQTADSDGDGMPDWWETIYDLNSASDEGDDGAMGDPDLDGLSNLAEYQISEVYKFCYLNPKLFRTRAEQPVSDYYLKQGSLTLGAMFSDHDFVEDQWENQYDSSCVSPYVYDPKGDADGDGWSNWAESRFRLYNSNGTRPDTIMTTSALGLMEYEFPVPIIVTTLSYSGLLSGGTLMLEFYSDPSMNGTPDATFSVPNDSTTVSSKTQALGYWESKTLSTHLSPGSIQPGTLNITFTDSWTGNTGDTGFDNNGIIYSTLISGLWDPIGTIDYTTGAMTLDLSYFEHMRLMDDATATNREDYIEIETSYVQMTYSVHAISAWPRTVYLGTADSGYVREGTNYVFAFVDLDSSSTWTPGEPCGVAAPFGVDVNWDANKAKIQLTDYTLGSLRMNISGVRSEDVFLSGSATGSGTSSGSSGSSSTTSGALENRIRVRRTVVDGLTSPSYQRIVLDKVLQSPRTYITEGDWYGQGADGFDWGLPGIPTALSRSSIVYDVFLGTASVLSNNVRIATFTNLFDSARAQAQCISPVKGAYVYTVRPTFKWSVPTTANVAYTAFAIEIRKGSDVGPVVYSSGTLQNPLRDVSTGYYSWTAPISAGDLVQNGQRLSSNSLYFWRVIALNAKYTLTASPITWSSWNVFRLDVNASPSSSGYGELRAGVKYYGPVTNLLNHVKVQVYDTAGFSGEPVAQYTLSEKEVAVLTNATASVSTNAVLRGLTPSASAGNYYVMAFIDQNGNGVRDAWESWGYYNNYGLSATPYTARSVEVKISMGTDFASLTIEDADTDQDWFPDAWEYEQNPGAADFLSMIGPSGAWKNGDTEVTTGTNLWIAAGLPQNSVAVSLAMGMSDQDGDGSDDLTELILGTDVNAVSTAGDGYSDSDKLVLGLSGADALKLGVTSFDVGAFEATVNWQVSVSKSSSVNRELLATITGVDSSTEVPYVVEYKASLSDANWTRVGSGTVALDGVKDLSNQIGTGDGTVIDPSKGFFRIRLGN